MEGTEVVVLAVGGPLVVSQIGLWITYARAIGRLEGKVDGQKNTINSNTKRIERLENKRSRRGDSTDGG